MNLRQADDAPLWRALRILAFDPSAVTVRGNLATLRVPYEPLQPGPRGRLVEVIDYDIANRAYYAPIDLDYPSVVMQGGVAPSEGDPRFHQQMVYAVATAVIRQFESACGALWQWKPLQLFPHAFNDANAFYDPRLHAVLFGYFQAVTPSDQGLRYLEGDTVLTCLSHDIIAHETTHALLHELRPYLIELTNPDALAFHEALADIVALLHHFTFEDALIGILQRTGGILHEPDLRPELDPGARAPLILAEHRAPNVLVALGQEFGEATGRRAALRSALGTPPDPSQLARAWDPHERGAILVAAVFDALLTLYATRLMEVLRIVRAGGGTVALDINRDLAMRLAREAAKLARRFLNICIRAIDYLPPVDVTFGDFLRALVTADRDLVPHDERSYRVTIIEAFRRRGIRPEGIRILGEEMLAWRRVEMDGRPLICPGLRIDAFHGGTSEDDSRNARILLQFARQNALALGLDPSRKVSVTRLRPALKSTAGGGLRLDLMAQLVQSDGSSGSTELRGGTSLIMSAEGRVRYALTRRLGDGRRQSQLAFLRMLAEADDTVSYTGTMAPPVANFAVAHRGY